MSYDIPLFDLNFDEAEEKAVLEVLRSRWISSGPKVQQLEERFAAMSGVPHAVALTNCTAALHLSMLLCDIGPGDQVICPSLTFVATVNAIRYAGAVPVFSDIKSTVDLNIDPDDIERKISPATRAIMVMHYAGFPCDMDRIMQIARRHGLRVIEDACHGPLSEYQGQKLGTIGDIGCFSFFSNKNISTGEGGMLITSDDALAGQCRLLRSHGMTTLSYDRARGHSTAYDVVAAGYNYRMDDIRAAIGLVQMGKLEADLLRRQRVREDYLAMLGNVSGLHIPFAGREGRFSNYIFAVVPENSTAERRDAVRQYMADRGVQTSVHYPAVHRFSIYSDSSQLLPNTEYVSDNLITLPMYGSLVTQKVERVAAVLKEALEQC